MTTKNKIRNPASAGQTAPAVRAYVAKLPPGTRRVVNQIRTAIRAAAPGAVEVPSYGIIGFRHQNRALVWCAGWAKHTSLYPISTAFARAHGIDISKYESAKGTIRFPLTAPPPLALIKRLVKARLAVVGQARAAKRGSAARSSSREGLGTR